MTFNAKPKEVVHFTSGNEKLQFTGRQNGCYVFSFGLPSVMTCPYASECVKFCYASSGNFMFPAVRNRLSDNYRFSRTETFAEEAIKELEALVKFSGKIPVVVRLHDSGDFYGQAYVSSWFKIMEALPKISFYTYTKSFTLIEAMEKVPANFKYIPSKGGIMDDRLKGRPCAVVVPEGTEQEDLPENTVLGSKDDLENLRNFLSGKTIALAAHGARKRAVTGER